MPLVPLSRPGAVAHSSAIGFSTINGLPAHVLLVHAVVVFVPLSALCLIAALRPTNARRFGVWLPAIAAFALASVLAAMNAGGWLQNHVQNTQLVRDHTKIAGQLWPFSAAVLLLSLVVWWFNGRLVQSAADGGSSGSGTASPPSSSPVAGRSKVTVVIGVLSVLVAAGSVVQVARIGDSGSRAAWHDHFSKTSLSGR